MCSKTGMMACSNNTMCNSSLCLFNVGYALLLLYTIIPCLAAYIQVLVPFLHPNITHYEHICIATYISFVCHQCCLWYEYTTGRYCLQFGMALETDDITRIVYVTVGIFLLWATLWTMHLSFWYYETVIHTSWQVGTILTTVWPNLVYCREYQD